MFRTIIGYSTLNCYDCKRILNGGLKHNKTFLGRPDGIKRADLIAGGDGGGLLLHIDDHVSRLARQVLNGGLLHSLLLSLHLQGLLGLTLIESFRTFFKSRG